jgi:hypothetical protein
MTAVVVVPCLPVERPQLREAWRSLVGQGRDKAVLPDDVVGRLLWLSRALPSVLDVLASVDLWELRLDPAVVEVVDAGVRGPLALVAWRRDDELCVEVLVVPAGAVTRGSVVDAVAVRLLFPFRLVRVSGEDDITAEDMKLPPDPVRLRRFSVGKS